GGPGNDGIRAEPRRRNRRKAGPRRIKAMVRAGLGRCAPGLSPAAAHRDPVHGFFERAAAGADLWHLVLLACRDRRIVDRDRSVRLGADLYSLKFLWSPLID